jgi:hypothetical protein
MRLTGEERKRKLRKLVLGDACVTVTLNVMLWMCIIIVWVATLPLIDSALYPNLKGLIIFAGLLEGIFISAGLTAVYLHLSRNRERLYVDIVGEE